MIDIITDNYQEIILNTARIFSSVFEIMLAYLLINNYFKPKPRFRRFDYFAFFLLAAIIILLQEYGGIGNFRYVAECLILTLMLITMYNGRLRHKLMGIAAFSGMVGISVLLSGIIFTYLSDHFNIISEITPFTELLKISLANIIMIPLSVLISILPKKTGEASNAFRLWMCLLTVPAVTLLTFSVFQYIIETYNPNEQITTYIYISCIGLILINAVVFVLFWFYQRQSSIKRENDILTSQLSLQENSIKNLENAYNRTRNFRHDIKNHLLTMNILAENGDLPEIRKYLKEMGGIIDESSYVRISGISAVDAILNEKLYTAQGDNITTGYDVVNMSNNNIKALDLCIILSNALDNAIEANRKIEDPDARYIKLRIHGNNEFTVISVSNPTSESPVKLGDNSYQTSKHDTASHGFGLKSIESTAKKYDGEMLTKCEDGVFTLIIRLCASES